MSQPLALSTPQIPARLTITWLIMNIVGLSAVPFWMAWDSGVPRVVLGMGVLTLWMLTPIVTALAIAWRLRQEMVTSWVLLLVSVGLFGFGGYWVLMAAVFYPDPQSPIVFVFLPVFQWLVLLVAVLPVLIAKWFADRTNAAVPAK